MPTNAVSPLIEVSRRGVGHQLEHHVDVCTRLGRPDLGLGIHDLPPVRKPEREPEARVQEVSPAHDPLLGVVAVDQPIEPVEIALPVHPEPAGVHPRRQLGQRCPDTFDTIRRSRVSR